MVKDIVAENVTTVKGRPVFENENGRYIIETVMTYDPTLGRQRREQRKVYIIGGRKCRLYK